MEAMVAAFLAECEQNKRHNESLSQRVDNLATAYEALSDNHRKLISDHARLKLSHENLSRDVAEIPRNNDIATTETRAHGSEPAHSLLAKAVAEVKGVQECCIQLQGDVQSIRSKLNEEVVHFRSAIRQIADEVTAQSNPHSARSKRKAYSESSPSTESGSEAKAQSNSSKAGTPLEHGRMEGDNITDPTSPAGFEDDGANATEFNTVRDTSVLVPQAVNRMRSPGEVRDQAVVLSDDDEDLTPGKLGRAWSMRKQRKTSVSVKVEPEGPVGARRSQRERTETGRYDDFVSYGDKEWHEI